MTADEILEELRPLGSEGYKKVMRRHGVQEPFFGVKVEELKKLQKRLKRDHQLALDLFATGNYDAQYLAGLIADDHRMTPDDLRVLLRQANCSAIRSSAVAWTVAESAHGLELAREWIDAPEAETAATGWHVWSNLVSLKPDAELDVPELDRLIERVATTIHQQPDGVRYAMNGFVIAVGCYVSALTETALAASARIGVVSVDLGETDCKVPDATAYIRKVQDRGTVGKKRKTARC